jgi:hypothetical protein
VVIAGRSSDASEAWAEAREVEGVSSKCCSKGRVSLIAKWKRNDDLRVLWLGRWRGEESR